MQTERLDRCDADGSSVHEEERPQGRRMVRIEGRLPVGWIGSLALGMAEAGRSIVRGTARRADRQRWKIELEVSGSPGGASGPVDYFQLASQRRYEAPRPIVVTNYAIERCPERRALVLDVTGIDCVGFLGSLLDRLSGVLLFPVEMEIDTVGSRAVDRLCLQALAGNEPSAEAREMLASVLDGLRGAQGHSQRPTGLSPLTNAHRGLSDGPSRPAAGAFTDC